MMTATNKAAVADSKCGDRGCPDSGRQVYRHSVVVADNGVVLRVDANNVEWRKFCVASCWRIERL